MKGGGECEREKEEVRPSGTITTSISGENGNRDSIPLGCQPIPLALSEPSDQSCCDAYYARLGSYKCHDYFSPVSCLLAGIKR